MFTKDIEQFYTDTVDYYINNGYRINYRTMSGHQGELAKIDLTNGKEIIRVLITSDNDFCYKTENNRIVDLDFIKIIVGKNTDKIFNSLHETIWNHHLEIISEYRFYRIGESYRSNFFGTKEEAISAKLKHYDRLKNSEFYYDGKEIVLSDKAKKIVLPFMKRQRKCSSITTKQIDKVYKTIRYEGNKQTIKYFINAKGGRYVLK